MQGSEILLFWHSCIFLFPFWIKVSMWAELRPRSAAVNLISPSGRLWGVFPEAASPLGRTKGWATELPATESELGAGPGWVAVAAWPSYVAAIHCVLTVCLKPRSVLSIMSLCVIRTMGKWGLREEQVGQGRLADSKAWTRFLFVCFYGDNIHKT